MAAGKTRRADLRGVNHGAGGGSAKWSLLPGHSSRAGLEAAERYADPGLGFHRHVGQ